MALLRSVAFIASILIAVTAPIAAQTLPTLTVTSPSGTITYDRSELEVMGMVSIKTTTPWNEGVLTFEGVPFTVLLEKAQAMGTMATVTALNDYSVDIPVSDFAEFGTILAIRRDGEYMSVDDQGPYFVIYPFDDNPLLQRQPYYGRAVWQVKALNVE